MHRDHRDRDERDRIVANLDHDYAVVRDLMHELLQETSEVKIKETTLETITAVRQATAGMGSDDGATCQATARILKLLLARIGEGLGYEPSETLELHLPHATVTACVGFDPGA